MPTGDGVTGPAQADCVKPAHVIASTRHGEGRQIHADRRAALHDGQRPDATKLMNETITGNEGVVRNRHMPRQQRPIRQDDVVTQPGIVPHVAVRHQKIVRANDGFFLQLV